MSANEDLLERCRMLIEDAKKFADADTTQADTEVRVISWSTESVLFMTSILDKKHVMVKHLDRALKCKDVKKRYLEILGALKGFEESLKAGDIGNFPAGFVV